MSLFKRELEEEVARLLAPRPDATEQDEHARYEKLLAADYVVLWEASRVEEFRRLGTVAARVRADGARWPLQRAATGAYASMVPNADYVLFDALTTAVNSGTRARTPEELTHAVDLLVAAVSKTCFDAERLAALETIARLGNASAVMLFLST